MQSVINAVSSYQFVFTETDHCNIYAKRCVMTIYQVLDEENQVYCEYMDLQKAKQSAQAFSLWDEDHKYHVEELESEPD